MRKFTVNCWCYISRQIQVVAKTEEQAHRLAWEHFANANLNRCELGDYGRETIDSEDVENPENYCANCGKSLNKKKKFRWEITPYNVKHICKKCYEQEEM